jgi:hypothetical protein
MLLDEKLTKGSDMELLVATLAHTARTNDDEGTTRLHLISDTIQNAPGLVNVRMYRSREPESYYFILTTWEDEEFWFKAQDRYNPKNLLRASAGELLTASPEQWLMHYLWGYSQPSAQPVIAAAHIINVRPDQAERVERSWIEGLRRQVTQPGLAFGFLARGRSEDNSLLHASQFLQIPTFNEPQTGNHSSNFLNVLSWPGDTQRKDFYADQHYTAISGFLSSVGVMRMLSLEPL